MEKAEPDPEVECLGQPKKSHAIEIESKHKESFMSHRRIQILSLIVCHFMVSSATAAERTVAGKIKSVDATKNSIRLDDLQLDVGRKTTITVDGKSAKLADIKPDQQAKIVYEDGIDTAISIAVGKEPERDFQADAKVLKELQGEWQCIAGEVSAKPQDKSVVRKENRRLTINGNSLTMARTGPGGKYGTYVGKFEVDSSNAKFDWIGKGPGEAAALVEWIGIYELDGDVLKLCFVYQKDGKAKRPTIFKSLPDAEPGLNHVFFTFKRDKE